MYMNVHIRGGGDRFAGAHVNVAQPPLYTLLVGDGAHATGIKDRQYMKHRRRECGLLRDMGHSEVSHNTWLTWFHVGSLVSTCASCRFYT